MSACAGPILARINSGAYKGRVPPDDRGPASDAYVCGIFLRRAILWQACAALIAGNLELRMSPFMQARWGMPRTWRWYATYRCPVKDQRT